jgi:8-oxo-dGTP diphosphatase
MSTPSPRIRVVACLIERGGHFLITQRKKESHLGHLWEFPGGKIEAGESPQDCAVRECREEIGVEVSPGEIVEEVRYDYPDVQVHLYFIKCELVHGEPCPLDCADLTWVTPGEFSRYRFPEADRGIIERYVQGRKKEQAW